MNEKQTNTRTASRNLSIAPIIDGWMKTIRQIKRLHEIITPQKVVGGGGVLTEYTEIWKITTNGHNFLKIERISLK